MLNAAIAGIASHRPTSVVTSAVAMPCGQFVRLGRDGRLGDHVERLHHAVDRAQQAEHRADRADQREVAQQVLEPHALFFADFLHGLDRRLVAVRSAATSPAESTLPRNESSLRASSYAS